MTDEEKEMVEASAIRIIAWIISNQRAKVDFRSQSEEISKAIYDRVIEIAEGAPFKVEANPDHWFGVYGTKE